MNKKALYKIILGLLYTIFFWLVPFCLTLSTPFYLKIIFFHAVFILLALATDWTITNLQKIVDKEEKK